MPDLRGRTPVYKSATLQQGSIGGEANHTLMIAEMPSHFHSVMASTSQGDTPDAAGDVLSANSFSTYDPGTSNLVTLQPATVGTVGGQPHNNMQPYLALNFVIALVGIYPTHS